MKTTRNLLRACALMSTVVAGCAIAAGSQASGPGGGAPARDPGVRGGTAGAGKPLPTLSAAELVLFNNAIATFQEVDSVLGTIPGESGSGLGPSFNLNSCAGCHAFPAVGGSSPQLNPQVSIATLHGANNRLPSFLSSDGPIREARFKTNSDGTPDGGVHDLFVITGRVDAPSGCQLAQTDFASQVSNGNVIFRIPTPTFGAGLIEAITDATILANESANAAAKSALGIAGHENRSANDGTITRFGWKAQNKSLVVFSGEAYNVEMGVTNEVFPNPRQTAPGCDTLGQPEDTTNLITGSPSDIVNFGMFMRLLAPPVAAASYGNVNAGSIQNGLNQFGQAGCVLCHTASMSTGNSSFSPSLSGQAAALFSDLLVHNMGSGLADGITQGTATGNEFRTAPLWGLGQRIFLLHDGRTTDLMAAIQAHSSGGSEANGSVTRFNSLSSSGQQDVLNFLRSL
jgi:CxxC motif-containing protein (DUF1111 family)